MRVGKISICTDLLIGSEKKTSLVGLFSSFLLLRAFGIGVFLDNPLSNNVCLQSKKIGYMYNVPGFLKKCFKPDKPPKERVADIIEEIA